MPAEKSHKKKEVEEYSTVQTAGLLVADPGRNNMTSEKSSNPRKEEESKFDEKANEEKESDNLSKSSEHACLNENKEKKVASRIRQLILQDKILVNISPPKQ